MSVNATGLGEMLTMPELSVQAAVRPGIPASAPDFLTIMALKAAPPAKGVAVGLPSAGDGNPTVEGAQPLVVPGADASETAESDVDMAFDLPLPAMPAPQPSASEPKASGARFAAVAARQFSPTVDVRASLQRLFIASTWVGGLSCTTFNVEGERPARSGDKRNDRCCRSAPPTS